MEVKIVLAGIGGQGIVFATKVLSQAALLRGEAVMASENHGMSQRGGSVMTHLKIGGSQAPLIRRGTADVLLAFDRVEALRSLPFLRAGGRAYVNSAGGLEPAVTGRLGELGIGLWTMDADSIAQRLGAPASTNLVVLGFAAAQASLGPTADDLKEAVRTLGPARAIDFNLKALDAGVAQALEANLLPGAL